MAKPVLDIIHPVSKSVPAALLLEPNCYGHSRGVPVDTSVGLIRDMPKHAVPLGCPVYTPSCTVVPACSTTKCLLSHYLRPDNAPWID